MPAKKHSLPPGDFPDHDNKIPRLEGDGEDQFSSSGKKRANGPSSRTGQACDRCKVGSPPDFSKARQLLTAVSPLRIARYVAMTPLAVACHADRTIQSARPQIASPTVPQLEATRRPSNATTTLCVNRHSISNSSSESWESNRNSTRNMYRPEVT